MIQLNTLLMEIQTGPFWGYRGGNWQKGNGLRIDHFLTTPEVTDLIKSVNVNREPRGWEKASDHTPVTIELVN